MPYEVRRVRITRITHSVDFNELYRNVTIHCPSFSLVRIDKIIVSVTRNCIFFLESTLRRNYHVSKLKNKLCIN